MFSTITTAPSTTIPKSSAPSESRFAGILLRSSQIEANIKANGIVNATIKAARIFPKKQKQNDRDQNHSFAEVVQHRMQGEMQQVAAVQHGNDLHAFGQDAIIELLHFLRESRRASGLPRPPLASARCPGLRRAHRRSRHPDDGSPWPCVPAEFWAPFRRPRCP